MSRYKRKRNFSLSDINPLQWLYALAVLVIIFIIYKVNGSIKNTFGVRSDKLDAFYIKLLRSKSSETLRDRTNAIFNSMCNPGTDETTLFSSVKGLNKHDLVWIYNEFGLRPYGFGSTLRIIGQDKNLLEWFNEELDDEEYEEMYRIWEKAIKLGSLNWIVRK